MAAGEEYGVLLYYKFVGVDDVEALASFYRSNCESLSLLGRVRLSSSGVNVTVGGELVSLEKHIEAVKSMSMFRGTDFKLAACGSPLDDAVARQCGFTSLSIRVVKELVTFSSCPLSKVPDVSNAGEHLSATEFHSVLQNAGRLVDAGSATDNSGVVLLDARNLYETRIGKFCSPLAQTLDPAVRQYSDLPSWIDDHAEQLRGKHVLMYCTGGIRCEMASAYIKSKGAGFENVFQLFGGIQRYLEQFPDGGFFKGRNFVFDHRISVGSSDESMLGTCLLCGLDFDDYSSRCRCFHCRMLVLVCDQCQAVDAIYVCELCQKQGKNIEAASFTDNRKEEETVPESNVRTLFADTTPTHQLDQGLGGGPSRKLRILCLHGFRQNASSFKGRTASLAKKLKHLVEFIYMDAPHELPFIYRPSSPNVSTLAEQIPPGKCNRKFAWLLACNCEGRSDTKWKLADAPFDPLQYQHQTEGLEDSLAHLKTVLSQQGPFDGILGFSQGAAMAALLCMERQREKTAMDFKFAILCSGFPAAQLAEMPSESIRCPSLHIFGSLVGADRQIANHASRDLASLFAKQDSVVIEHECGHIIPTRHPYIDNIRSFLQRFAC